MCTVHCDVKPQNMFVGERRGRVFGVIGDFDVSADAQWRATTTVHFTAGYVAPEVLAGEIATQCSDVYAFGLSVYDILVGPREQEWQGIAVAMGKARIAIPKHHSIEGLPEALQRMLEVDAKKRATTREMLQHAVFKRALSEANVASSAVVVCGIQSECDPDSGEVMRASNGVQCSRGHFICDEDLALYVRSWCDDGNGAAHKRSGGLLECYRGDCADVYEQSILAQHMDGYVHFEDEDAVKRKRERCEREMRETCISLTILAGRISRTS